MIEGVVSYLARLLGDDHLAETDEEDEGTDAETDLTNYNAEENGETDTEEHLSHT